MCFKLIEQILTKISNLDAFLVVCLFQFKLRPLTQITMKARAFIQLFPCIFIKLYFSAKIPEKPGAGDNTTTATELLEKMRDKLPDKAKAKLEQRKKELEKIELEKIHATEKEQVAEKTGPSNLNKPKIPAHILAKIRAKQAAKAEELATNSAEKTIECDVLSRAPKAASMLRSYFVTEKKSVYPLDSACKKIQRSWKVPIT